MSELENAKLRLDAEYSFARMCKHIATIRDAIEHSKNKYDQALAKLVDQDCVVPALRAKIEVRYDYFLAELAVTHMVHCTLLTSEKNIRLDSGTLPNNEWVKTKLIDLANRYSEFHGEILVMLSEAGVGKTLAPDEPAKDNQRRWWQIWKRA